MKAMLAPRSVTVLILLLVAAVAAPAVGGQQDKGGIDELAPRREYNAPATTNRKRPKSNRQDIVYRDRIVYRPATPTSGSLTIFSEPNASILVEPLTGKGREKVQDTVNEKKVLQIGDLLPGQYRVAAELDGYEGKEQRPVSVMAGKDIVVNLELQPITHTLTITTNVPSGRVNYASVVEGGKDAKTGEIKYVPKKVGGCWIPIENKRAVFTNLLPGKYGVDVKADDVGYDTAYGVITVPGETNEVNIPLTYVVSSAPFSNIAGDQWDLPANWRIASHLLTVNGRGVAFPRLNAYRHYKDFQLVSRVKMVNGTGVAFALRATIDANRQDYYLVQITGATDADLPRLNFFVVKNGEPQPLQSIPFSKDAMAETLKAGSTVEVWLKMKDNDLNVHVTNNQTGIPLHLGTVTDPDRNFPVGAVGVAAVGIERNEIGFFSICTPECPK